MNILIINLTRFGDLIQTQPVIAGFKSHGHRVGLACLENFAGAATMLQGVDAVFSLNGARLLADLDGDWRQAVRSMSEFRNRIFDEFQPAITVNLTPSISSRVLSYALTPTDGESAGFTMDEFGFNADTSSWAAFLQMAGANRGASPFNVCDLFRKSAGLDKEGNSLVLAPASADALARADELLGPLPEGARGFVALQLGASEERRRWPIDNFRQVARSLYEHDGLVPVLLGTKSESHLGERFAEGVDFPLGNCMGQTSLPELAGVLSKCALLVTNDTGTMHLAAGQGVPLCSVFLATAQPWDTGPYRAGNICLEPDVDCHPCEFGKPCPIGEQCRQSVTPKAMYGYAKQLLDGTSAPAVEGTRAWLTVTGDDGFMELSALSGHGTTDRALWIELQRRHFSRFLDGELLTESTGLGRKIRPQTREELSNILTSTHDMLFLLLKQGMVLLKNPRPQAKTKFLASWQRVQTLLSSSKHLNILGLLWMFESQRAGENMVGLLELAERYRSLFALLRDEFA